MDRFERDLMPSSSGGELPASSPTTPNASSGGKPPIKTVSQFTAAMLEGAREQYRDEAIRKATAARLS